MTDSAPAPVPAGWYPDPDSPGIVRWWDGEAWTERRAPAAPPAAPRQPSDEVASGVFAGSVNFVIFVVLVLAIVLVLAYNFD
jgi:hypothetical protein